MNSIFQHITSTHYNICERLTFGGEHAEASATRYEYTPKDATNLTCITIALSLDYIHAIVIHNSGYKEHDTDFSFR